MVSPSIWQQQAAGGGERKLRIVRNFPEMPVRIGEVSGVAAPEHIPRGPDQRRSRAYRPRQCTIDL
jgi:hypothetical protein